MKCTAKSMAQPRHVWKKGLLLAGLCLVGTPCGRGAEPGLQAASPAKAGQVAEIYLFAGQSNMWGTGTTADDVPPEMRGAQPGVQILRRKPGDRAAAFVPLENGVNNNHPGGSWGCETLLMSRLAASRPAGSGPLYVVKHALGGSWLAAQPNQRDWNPASRNELLDELLGQLADARQLLEKQGFTPQVRALIWMQGESDCNEEAPANAYAANLQALIERVRKQSNESQLPVYLGRIHNKYRGPFLQQVRAAQATVAVADPNIHLFSTDGFGLLKDQIHFSPAGQLAVGQAVLDLITGQARQKPAVIATGQTFSLRAFAGAGTRVGTVALAQPGSPTPTFTVGDPAFEIEGETGVLRVRDGSGLNPEQRKEITLPIAAPNGVAPTGNGTIRIVLKPPPPPGRPQGCIALLDPNATTTLAVENGGVARIVDAQDGTMAFTANAAKRPVRAPFPGTTRQSLHFDGTRQMEGPGAQNWLQPGSDEDFTLAAAIHIPPHELKGQALAIVINKSRTQGALAIGFDYGQNLFFGQYANAANGTLVPLLSSAPITPGSAHAVRLRKVGDTCRLYVDGKLAATGKVPVRRAILAAQEGAPLGLGGTFPAAPGFVGTLGQIIMVRSVPTLREDAWIDGQLAAFGGITLTGP